MVFSAIGIFLKKWFKFWPYVCHGYHDALMMSVNIKNITVLNIGDIDYCCIINKNYQN